MSPWSSSHFRAHWKRTAAIAAPLLLPLAAWPGATPASKCAYVICIMAAYWILELAEIPVTALIPAALFPLLGIMGTAEVSSLYFNSSIMLMFGSRSLAKSLFTGVKDTGL